MRGRRTGSCSGAVLDRSEFYAPEHHWGSAEIDLTRPDLPALKARYLVDALPRSGRVLEVGCGSGRLLHTIAAHRPGLELHGCDIRPLRNPPRQFEFSLVDPDAPSLPFDPASFDAVVLFDVLEHLRDPQSTLRAARQLLRPGASLVSFTPLEGQPLSFYRLYRKLLGDDLYLRTKEHLQAFSEVDLRTLVEKEFVIRDRRYAYHLVGQLMDATLFALMKFRAVRARFWETNPYYAEDEPNVGGSNTGSSGSAFGAALRAANALAYGESRLLGRSSFGAAGILFTATPR